MVRATRPLITRLSKSTWSDRFRWMVTHLVNEEKEHGSAILTDPVTTEKLKPLPD